MPSKVKVVALVLLTLLATLANAGISESSEWIVVERQHTAIQSLKDYTAAPDALKHGEVYVLVDAGAAYATVHVIADQKADAKTYARILDEWSPADALYSQEDDYAAAVTYIQRNAWFQTESTLDLDVADLLARLRTAGLNPHPGIIVGKHASVQPKGLHVAHDGSTTYLYDPAAEPAAGKIKISARLNAVQTIGPWIMIFGPLVVMLVTFGFAIVVAKNTRIPVERRRELYEKLLIKPIYISIGLCMPLVFYLIFTKQIYPLADLWFGERSVSNFISLMMPTLFLPLVMFVPMSKIETKLFGKNPDEPGDAEVEPLMPAQVTDTTLQKRIYLVLFLVGLAIVCGSIFLPKQLSGVGTIVRMAALLLVFSSTWLSRTISKRFKQPAPPEPSKDPLVQKVQRIGTALDRQVDQINVFDSPVGQTDIAFLPDQGVLTLSREATTDLTEAEQEFAIAYALNKDPARMVRTTLLTILPIAGVGALLMTASISVVPLPIVMLVLVALMAIPVFIFIPKITIREECRALEKALALTKDYEAARSYLAKYHAQLAQQKLSKRQQDHLATTKAELEKVCEKLANNPPS